MRENVTVEADRKGKIGQDYKKRENDSIFIIVLQRNENNFFKKSILKCPTKLISE